MGIATRERDDALVTNREETRQAPVSSPAPLETEGSPGLASTHFTPGDANARATPAARDEKKIPTTSPSLAPRPRQVRTRGFGLSFVRKTRRPLKRRSEG